MDHVNYGTYTDLLSLDDEIYEPNSVVESQPPNVIGGSTMGKHKRKANFTKDEDILLVSAWLNTSKDAVIGSQQNSSSFWGRISEYIVSNEGDEGRSIPSLKYRWADINKQCAKFAGCVVQQEDLNQSGQTQHGRVINDLKNNHVLYDVFV